MILPNYGINPWPTVTQGIYERPARRKVKRVYNRLVKTPHGYFTSFVKASEALIVDRRTIKSYCLSTKKDGWVVLLGDEAKVVPHRLINKSTSRFIRSRGASNLIRKKAVMTPFGVFKSAKECSQRLGLPYDTVLYRLVRCKVGRFPDWHYKELPKWELQ